MKKSSRLKIISGGQTGVDRGALDAALDLGITCGGWCPEGRLAEDGVISRCYPVRELPGADYRQRTLANVLAADGTLLIYFAYPEGGTQETLRFCLEWQKPCLLIDAAELDVARAAQRITEFLDAFSIMTLNVAGPRASSEARACDYARSCLSSCLKSVLNRQENH